MSIKGPAGAKVFLTDDEKKNPPVITKEFIKRVMGYMKPYWFQFSLIIVIVILSALIGLLPPYFTGRVVNVIENEGRRIIADTDNISDIATSGILEILKYVALAFITAILGNTIRVLETLLNSWISQHIIYDMKSAMYRHLQFMQHAFFTTERPGEIITRMTSDIEGINSIITGTLSAIINDVAIISTCVAYLLYLNWQMTIIGLILMPLLILPNRVVGKKKWLLLSRRQAKRDELNQQINETLSASGSHLIKLYTREDEEYEKFNKTLGEVTQLAIKEQRTGKWFSTILGVFSSLSSMLIYAAGGVLMFLDRASISGIDQIVTINMLLSKLFRPVTSLLNIQVDVTRSMALFTRIFDYFDMCSTVVTPENPIEPDLADPEISFENVSFAYDEINDVIHDVSFTLPPGKMYAVVGPSGAGKSTIINMIPRLYDPTAGRVSINGADVKEIDLKYLRKSIGIVTQETYLFNGTIRENLLFAKADATDEELIAACKAANIHDFIDSQPKKYETVVGNRGLKLSGGEKQRVSIARVILKDPKILILDEATSSLDSISESLIQDALEGIMKNRTCIVIAHRLSTILSSDRILVIENGRIAEEGEHMELLAIDGVYKELFDTQFRRVLDIEYELQNHKH